MPRQWVVVGGCSRADTRSSNWSPSCTLVSPLPLHTCTTDQRHTLKMYSFVLSWQNKDARWHTHITDWSLSASLSYALNALVWRCGSAALWICEWGLILVCRGNPCCIHAITSAANQSVIAVRVSLELKVRNVGPCEIGRVVGRPTLTADSRLRRRIFIWDLGGTCALEMATRPWSRVVDRSQRAWANKRLTLWRGSIELRKWL